MHSLMISDVFFPRINGVSTSIESFREALAPLGIRTSLIVPAYPAQTASSETPSIHRIRSLPLPFDPEDRLMMRGTIRKLLPALREDPPDLIHVQTPFAAHYAGLEIARALGIPCVASYHTYFEEYLFHYIPLLPRNWLRRLARSFSRGQCNDLDGIVVPSRAMVETLGSYGVTAPLHVLPTGLAESRFVGGNGDFFRLRYGIPADRKVLLYVGRVAFEKNIEFLLDMLLTLKARQPDAMLLITGEGPALGELQHRSANLGLSEFVRFIGYLDRHTELHDCYRAADLFVFASRTETQGLVLLEAMALGTPAVALAEMGTRDILEGERGCRIAPNDPAGFAELVADLLENPATLKLLSIEARQYARSWSAQGMAARLSALYGMWTGKSAGITRIDAPTAAENAI